MVTTMTTVLQMPKALRVMPISVVTGTTKRLKQVCIMEWRIAIRRNPPATTYQPKKIFFDMRIGCSLPYAR